MTKFTCDKIAILLSKTYFAPKLSQHELLTIYCVHQAVKTSWPPTIGIISMLTPFPILRLNILCFITH